jgi:CDP-diacylglycerol--serine O-phosphatidyltransferase
MRLAIATLFTFAHAICGFIGIAVLMHLYGPQVTTACLLVFGAWLFDTADGMVARRLGVDSPLGATLDSLCDVVSFAVLPAAILVHGSEADYAQLFAIVASSTYLLAAIFRIARYTATTLADSAAKPRFWFEGLPVTAAAMCFAAAVLASIPAVVQAVLAIVLALLMVSTLPYPDLVKFYLPRKLPLWSLLPAFAVVVIDWRRGLAVLLACYICVGPIITAGRAFRRRNV